MGFDFGAFAGGFANSALDTYVRGSETRRLREDQDFKRTQQKKIKDMQAQLEALPAAGAPDPEATHQGGIPLSQLQANNPDAYDYANAQPGQQFAIAPPPPATPPAALPGATAPPAPQPQQYYVYQNPDDGALYATATPTTATQQALDRRRIDIYKNSGLPEYAQLGLAYEQDAREREKFDLERDSAEMRLGVGQGWLYYQRTGDAAGAIEMATKPFNADTKYTGNYKVEYSPTKDGSLIALYRNAQGDVVYSNPPKKPLDIFSELAAATEPGGLLTLRNTLSEMELKQRQLDQADRGIGLQERQVAVAEGNAESEAALREKQGAYYGAQSRQLSEKADLIRDMRNPDPAIAEKAQAAYLAMHGKSGAKGSQPKISFNPNAMAGGPAGYITSGATAGQPGTAMLFGEKVLGGTPLRPEYWYSINQTLAAIPPELNDVIKISVVDGVPRYSAKIGDGRSVMTEDLNELIAALSQASAPQQALPAAPPN